MTPIPPQTELPPDRRKHKRYKAKEGALISPVARERKYWKIVDISMGGASFRYIPCEDLKSFSKIDIAMQDLDFALEGIPFTLISDCDFADDLPSLSKLRRCSVKFGSMSHPQESLLDEFIRKYTEAFASHSGESIVGKGGKPGQELISG